MNISDTIEKHSKEILRGKRQALKDGDAAVHAQIGEGKDILSILSTSVSLALFTALVDGCSMICSESSLYKRSESLPRVGALGAYEVKLACPS